jgi:hypothetical protein
MSGPSRVLFRNSITGICAVRGSQHHPTRCLPSSNYSEHLPDSWPARYSSIIVVPMIRAMRAAISDEMRAVANASGRSSHTSCRRKSGGDRNSSLHIVRHVRGVYACIL